jgi:hypothetical protein
MKLFSYLAVAALASAATFGTIAATGFASPTESSSHLQPPTSVKVGQSFKVWSLDLWCAVLGKDRFGHEAGPVLYCDRSSHATGTARGMGMSSTHFFITTPNARSVAVRIARTP